MKQALLLLATLWLLLPATSCTKHGDDWDVSCAIASQTVANKDIAPEARGAVLHLELGKRLKTPDVIRAYSAIGGVPQEKKYAILRKAAKESGRADWDCPAVAEILTYTGR